MIVDIPPYLLLVAAVFLIYLVDCIVVLYANEAVIKPDASGSQVDFGSRQAWVAGKRIHLLNPLTPLTPSYRTHWSVAEHLTRADDEASAAWARHLALVGRLATPIRATAWVVLIVLPIAMMLWGALGFLVGAGISWLVVIALLVRFLSCRKDLGLAWGEALLLAFECLACPPCAVNLMRKLSLRYRMNIDLVGLVAGMPADRAAAVLERIGEQVDAHLSMMDDDTADYTRTCIWREQLRTRQASLMTRKDEHELQ